MKELKKRFRSLYWQQFSLIAGILLLTLLLLGASFYALSYNYLVREKREEMQTRAQVIAQMTADYLAASEADQEVDSSLSRMAGVASMMTEVNFLICDENGQAMLTTDNACRRRYGRRSWKTKTASRATPPCRGFISCGNLRWVCRLGRQRARWLAWCWP